MTDKEGGRGGGQRSFFSPPAKVCQRPRGWMRLCSSPSTCGPVCVCAWTHLDVCVFSDTWPPRCGLKYVENKNESCNKQMSWFWRVFPKPKSCTCICTLFFLSLKPRFCFFLLSLLEVVFKSTGTISSPLLHICRLHSSCCYYTVFVVYIGKRGRIYADLWGTPTSEGDAGGVPMATGVI